MNYPCMLSKKLQLGNVECLVGFQDCGREHFMLFSIIPVPVSGNLSQPQTFDTFFIVLWLDSLSFKTTTQDANSFKRCS